MALGMSLGPSSASQAAAELVVPRSMPMIGSMRLPRVVRRDASMDYAQWTLRRQATCHFANGCNCLKPHQRRYGLTAYRALAAVPADAPRAVACRRGDVPQRA